jgi:hypothetical protein
MAIERKSKNFAWVIMMILSAIGQMPACKPICSS